ncbi:MAG TPA: hypothetical protein VFY65_07195, partial [Longimicrobium sp.]|nr:hypothetical protein [Longimicrobium sp.]
MSLRQRIVLTLVGISVLLAIPAAYGLLALNDLHQIAHQLDEAGVEATAALGELRNHAETVSEAQRRYVARYPVPTNPDAIPADTIPPRLQVDSAVNGGRRALALLRADTTYAGASTPAEQLWAQIAASITTERRLMGSDLVAAAPLRRTLED